MLCNPRDYLDALLFLTRVMVLPRQPCRNSHWYLRNCARLTPLARYHLLRLRLLAIEGFQSSDSNRVPLSRTTLPPKLRVVAPCRREVPPPPLPIYYLFRRN